MDNDFNEAGETISDIICFPYNQDFKEALAFAVSVFGEEKTTNILLSCVKEEVIDKFNMPSDVFAAISQYGVLIALDNIEELKKNSFDSFEIPRKATAQEKEFYANALELEHKNEPHECQKAKTGKCCGKCHDPKPK